MARGVAMARATIRYGIAALVATFMLCAGIALGGAGHGWVSGGFGCFALAPTAFVACANALTASPSRRSAIATLTLGLLACIVVFAATLREGVQHFYGYWPATGIAGVVIGVIAYLNWLLTSAFALARTR